MVGIITTSQKHVSPFEIVKNLFVQIFKIWLPEGLRSTPGGIALCLFALPLPHNIFRPWVALPYLDEADCQGVSRRLRKRNRVVCKGLRA